MCETNYETHAAPYNDNPFSRVFITKPAKPYVVITFSFAGAASSLGFIKFSTTNAPTPMIFICFSWPKCENQYFSLGFLKLVHDHKITPQGMCTQNHPEERNMYEICLKHNVKNTLHHAAKKFLSDFPSAKPSNRKMKFGARWFHYFCYKQFTKPLILMRPCNQSSTNINCP